MKSLVVRQASSFKGVLFLLCLLFTFPTVNAQAGESGVLEKEFALESPSDQDSDPSSAGWGSGFLTQDFLSNVSLGALFIMLVYHLLLFFIRRCDRSPLYFSLIVLMVLIRTLLLEFPFQSGGDLYDFGVKLEYLSLFGLAAFFFLFLGCLYPQEFRRGVIRLNLIGASLLTLGTLFLPLEVASLYLMNVFRVLMLFEVVFVVIQLLRAMRQKRGEIYLFFFGILTLLISSVNDTLFYARILPTVPLVDYGLLIFVFFQTAIMAVRYKRAFQQNEDLKLNLEAMVEKRTNELSSAMKALEEVSLTDPLTGLRNRRYVYETVFTETKALLEGLQFHLDYPNKRQGTGDKGSQAVLVLDIDHFKQTNDEYGHDAGDRILQQFSQVLTSCVRTDDLVVRWGGEEFLILLKNVLWEEALMVAEKIRRRIFETRFTVNEGLGTGIAKTISIGISSLPFYWKKPKLASCSQVIRMADLALYEAKRSGRNAVVSILPGSRVSDLENPESWNLTLEKLREEDIVRMGLSKKP